jgi:hypothetical protein
MQHQASLGDESPLDRILATTEFGELIGIGQQIYLFQHYNCNVWIFE